MASTPLKLKHESEISRKRDGHLAFHETTTLKTKRQKNWCTTCFLNFQFTGLNMTPFPNLSWRCHGDHGEIKSTPPTCDFFHGTWKTTRNPSSKKMEKKKINSYVDLFEPQRFGTPELRTKTMLFWQWKIVRLHGFHDNFSRSHGFTTVHIGGTTSMLNSRFTDVSLKLAMHTEPEPEKPRTTLVLWKFPMFNW